MSNCIFCEIVAQESPAHVVFRDELAVGFLDTTPLFPGHVLVVPREHHVTLGDLPPELVEPLFARARLVARAVEETLGAQGTFVAMNNIVSQSVPHLHVHVVPRTKGDGLRGFFWPRNKYDSEAHAAETASALADGYRQQRSAHGWDA